MLKSAEVFFSILLAAALFTTPSLLRSTNPNVQKEQGEGLGRTAFVSCFDDTGATVKPRKDRSDILVSPDGRLRAYVEVRVSVTSRESIPPCANTSTVYVATQKNAFREIYAEKPTDTQSGNGIELADWSPDNRFLLFSVVRWVYESDSWDFSLVLYDTSSGLFHRPNHNRIFGQHLGKACTLEVRGVGFTAQREIVFWARDSVDLEQIEIDEGKPAADALRCLKQPGLWLLDWQANKLRRLPAGSQVKRHGRIEPTPKG